MLRSLFEISTFFCLSLILFSWGLSSQEVIGFDSRFYLFALEMWQQGVNWFPTTYFQLYPDYPATSTLVIYLFAKLWGGIDKFAAVLPTAVASAMTLTLTYLIGALQSKKWGISAVFFLLMTLTFLKSARSIAIDMYIAMITTGCFYLIYSADLKNKPLRVWLVYPLLLLGFAFRGPIGLIMPTGVICMYYLLDGNFKKFLTIGFMAFFALLLSTSILLSIAYHLAGYSFMHEVMQLEFLGRMQNVFLPPYFYFTYSLESYALSYPLAWLVMIGIGWYALRTRCYTTETRFLTKVFGWMLIILIGMSIPGDKKIRYILPMTPALALIVAYIFVAPPRERYFMLLRGLLLRFFLVIPCLFLIAISALWLLSKELPISQLTQILIILSVLQLLSLIVFYGGRRAGWGEAGLLFCSSLAFVCVYLLVIEPITLHINRAHDVVVGIEEKRLLANAQLVFYKEKPDGLAIKYVINMPQQRTPLFIENREDLSHFSQPAFFVTEEAYFADLPQEIALKFRTITQENLGHKKVLVFTQAQQ
jgi:4-amino-4-deoxy-L-arabinose transferase-like glycosyltransferase